MAGNASVSGEGEIEGEGNSLFKTRVSLNFSTGPFSHFTHHMLEWPPLMASVALLARKCKVGLPRLGGDRGQYLLIRGLMARKQSC